MTLRTEYPAVVFRRRDQDAERIDDRRMRSEISDGTYTRIVAGSYVLSKEWTQLTAMDQHLARVFEVVDRARGPLVITHASAAAVHGIDRLGAWPSSVDVRIPRSSGGRSSGAVRRLALGFDGVDLEQWRGHLITTPAQTALDLAAASGFTDAVVALDQALWARRDGGALTDIDRLRQVRETNRRRGMRRAAAPFDFSTHLSDSVRESEGRVLIHRLGFPAPVLQKEFILPGGRRAFSDYYFEDFDHVGEFDGTGKYFDPDILRGRTPRQALLEEKDREDALRRMVSAMSRWRTPAHRDPGQLYDILVADGLPSRYPRPVRR